jgi:CheY-like chemotaxis protein
MKGGNYSRNRNQEATILVVNDLRAQLDLMNSALRKAGYCTFTAEAGCEAFDIAKREQPDLIISDVSMPKLNGIEFCQLIRRDEELKATPILLVSALPKDTATVIEGLAAGADEYLEFPFDLARLIALVARLIERGNFEVALRHSEQRYRLLFECMPQPIGVCDEKSGAGILAEDIPSIFEPFFTKRRGGTGLGLAIAKKIMKEHGAKLIAANNPAGGARLIARFPVPG